MAFSIPFIIIWIFWGISIGVFGDFVSLIIDNHQRPSTKTPRCYRSQIREAVWMYVLQDHSFWGNFPKIRLSPLKSGLNYLPNTHADHLLDSINLVYTPFIPFVICFAMLVEIIHLSLGDTNTHIAHTSPVVIWTRKSKASP